MNKQKLLNALKLAGSPPEILRAFESVNREDFVPEPFRLNAYDDIPIPLSEPESSLSQPSTLAIMLQLLQIQPNSKILEIGSGSGYLLALMSELSSAEIFGLEINSNLAIQSTKILAERGNVHVLNKDGSSGLMQQSPFDRIIISAALENIGQAYQVLDQLADPGIMVVPIKDSLYQILKENHLIKKHEFPGFKFVKFKKENPNF